MDEQGQVSDAPEAVSGEGFFSKWATRKLFVLIMPVGLVLLLAVSATIFLLKRTITQRQVARIQIQKPQETIRAEQLHKNATVEEAPATGIKQASPEKTEILHFTDFMIDLKDAQGKSHVLFCDLAFEIAGTGQNERAEKITLIRGAIIKAAQARPNAVRRVFPLAFMASRSFVPSPFKLQMTAAQLALHTPPSPPSPMAPA